MDAIALLQMTYAAFNARDFDTALAAMHPDVTWPNGMEGGSVHGHGGIREYWTRQWAMIDPCVQPMRFTLAAGGRVSVEVRQVVRDLAGKALKDTVVHHVYSFEDGLIKAMEIRDWTQKAE